MNRCSTGQTYWRQAHDYSKPASYRAAALIVYQEHLDACQECAMAEAAEYQKAANAKIYDWDLQEVTK